MKNYFAPSLEMLPLATEDILTASLQASGFGSSESWDEVKQKLGL